MIYLDSSVALARLLDEDRRPEPEFWAGTIRSSKLIEYEIWNRLFAYGQAEQSAGEARLMLDAIDLLDLSPEVLARALQPFPVPLRTLDALHLATMVFLRHLGLHLELASYDVRLLTAAAALGFSAAHV